MTIRRQFNVSANEEGLTLAAALRAWLPDATWSQVRQQISGRRVLVGGTLCVDQGRLLQLGEVVELTAEPLPPLPGISQVVLRHVDPHVVVVEKPPGMTTLRHPSERRWPAQRKALQPSLDEAAAMLVARKEDRPRIAPLRSVHRIDRDTSGLLVFARTPAAEQALIRQFAAHMVQRRYEAAVLGHLAARTMRSHLVRDRGDGLRGSTKLPDIGQLAVTHVTPLRALGEYSLIECRLETGRTHQIRIHLTEAGHPLCGDRVYRSPFAQLPLADDSGAPRLALHAAELGFLHPATGESLHFEMPLPADLARFVARLEGG